MNTAQCKETLAMIIPGGVGRFQNIPSLIDLFFKISETYSLHFYSFGENDIDPRLIANGCTLTTAPPVYKKFRLFEIMYFLRRIRKDHGKYSFHAIHGFWIIPQGLTAVLAGKLLKLKSIVSLLGGDVVYLPSIRYGSAKDPIARSVIRWCLRSAGQVTVLTREQKNAAKVNGLDCDRASIIPFGIDPERFTFQPRKFSTPLQLIFVGSVNAVKDPFTLLRTFALLCNAIDCRLTIAGSDVMHGAAWRFAESLRVNEKVDWKGMVPHDDLPALLHQSDILLLPSRYEGQGVVVLEAFAAGVVVLGTKVGFLADYGSESITVQPCDAEGLARKVLSLLEHPEEVEALQLRQRDIAVRFTSAWTCKQYLTLYE